MYHTIFLNLLNEGIMPIGEVSQKEMYETALNEPDWVDDAQKIQELVEKIKSRTDTKYELNAFDVTNLKKDVEFDLQTLNEIRVLLVNSPGRLMINFIDYRICLEIYLIRKSLCLLNLLAPQNILTHI